MARGSMKRVTQDTLDIARLSVGNAFYHHFARLVAAYMSVGGSLGDEAMEQRISNMANPYSSGWEKSIPLALNVTSQDKHGIEKAHPDLLAALSDEAATTVRLDGQPLCEWRPNVGWYFLNV